MDISTKLTYADMAAQTWGAAYLREFDLIIAANELASMRSGELLYNDPFNKILAGRLVALDQDLVLQRLPDVEIPQDSEEPWKAQKTAINGTLGGTPRGTYAVFRSGETYDAYMSDGFGGITGRGSYTSKKTADAAAHDEIELYAHVISMMAFLHRSAVRNAIIQHSCKMANILPGREIQNVTLQGKTFSRVVFEKTEVGYFVGKGDAYIVRGHRRGAKPTGYRIESGTLLRIFNIDLVMPAEFADAGNEARIVDFVKPRAKAA